ncbi:hypothetical protein C9383_07925 [Pseudomonas palleroniana]|nr:hypothetical protein C9383_07925 [Pseudomonas palleroniana]
MVLGAMGALKVGESGLCAMIERKLLKACKIKSPPKGGLRLRRADQIRTASSSALLLSTARSSPSVRSSHRQGPCTG